MEINTSIKKHLIIFLGALLLFFIFAGPSVQAAAWHQGTPSALRGNWQSAAKTEAGPNGKAIIYYTLSFSKTAISTSATINGKSLEYRIRPVDYQRISKNTYLVRNHASNGNESLLTINQVNKKKMIVGNGTKNTNKMAYYKVGK